MIPPDMEETQEIVRVAFDYAPPMSGDDPLEATHPIYLPEVK